MIARVGAGNAWAGGFILAAGLSLAGVVAAIVAITPDPRSGLWLPSALIAASTIGRPRGHRIVLTLFGGALVASCWLAGRALFGSEALAPSGLWLIVGAVVALSALAQAIALLDARGRALRPTGFAQWLIGALGVMAAGAVLALAAGGSVPVVDRWLTMTGSLVAILPLLWFIAHRLGRRGSSINLTGVAGGLIGAVIVLGLIAVIAPRAAPSLAFAIVALAALRGPATVWAVAATAPLLGLHPATVIHSGATPDPFLLLFGLVAIMLGGGFAAQSRAAPARLRRARRAALVATREASTDPLTGLLNRRGLDRALATLIANSQRDGVSLFVMLADLDGLKPLNDRDGHAAGDAALIRLGDSIRQCVRRGDAVGRIGGDEFALVVAGSSPDRMRSIDAAIHARFAAANAATSSQADFSAGIAQHRAGATAAELMAAADAAMYVAKRGGGGRTNWANEVMPNAVEKTATPDYQRECR